MTASTPKNLSTPGQYPDQEEFDANLALMSDEQIDRGIDNLVTVLDSRGDTETLVEKGVRPGTCKPGQRADLTHCTPASRGPKSAVPTKKKKPVAPKIVVPAATQPWVPKGHVASPKEYLEAKRLADQQIENAPLPPPRAVENALRELELARKGLIRAGGESRGGNSTDRRNQRDNLFEKFGGEKKGYIVCHGCGRKIHKDETNPKGLMRMERGKIFTKCQGGGYQLPNLLPECFNCNRTRNDTRVKPGNEEGCK